MMLDRLRALTILSECTGADIWSVEYCREKRIPDVWIEELADTFESGFRTDRQTIYENEKVVNQYHGVRDLDLAIRLGEYLGVDTNRVTSVTFSPEAAVIAIKEAVDE